MGKSCICLCKDTNFKANHNSIVFCCVEITVVYAYAKILILKQITTLWVTTPSSLSCICLCKDTNFKANHNTIPKLLKLLLVVYAYAKILILKQITTILSNDLKKYVLYMPMQRY